VQFKYNAFVLEMIEDVTSIGRQSVLVAIIDCITNNVFVLQENRNARAGKQGTRNPKSPPVPSNRAYPQICSGVRNHRGHYRGRYVIHYALNGCPNSFSFTPSSEPF